MKRKLIIIAFVLVVLTLITVFVYRHYFEFKNSEVRRLINEEAAKWPGNESTAAGILNDACKHILNDWRLTAQVRKVAEATGIPKEKALVDAAIAQSFSLGYFKEA